MLSLASSYFDAGRRDEALRMRDEVLSRCQKILGPDNPSTLWAMDALANSCHDAGRRDEALKLREEALAIRRKVSGPEHPDTLGAMHSLAISYYDTGRRDEALKLREEVLPLYRKADGSEHPRTLAAMLGLAISYAHARRPEEAIKIREEVLAVSRKLLGPENPNTLIAMTSLADSYGETGRMDEALPLLSESSSRLPNDTILSQKVAALQAWFGRDADHVATCRRILELAAKTTDPSTAERAAKSCCLLPSSDPQLIDAALALARLAVDLGKNHGYMAYYQMALGMAEYRHGNYAAADAALTAAEQAGKDNRHVRDSARFFHAMSLFRQSREAEARKLFTEAEAQMKPLPADERQPLANRAGPDDIIVWLACKEAKALFGTETKQ